jgi:hypothetical protein
LGTPLCFGKLCNEFYFQYSQTQFMSENAVKLIQKLSFKYINY